MTAVVLLVFVIVAAACACVVSLCFDAGVEAERVFEYAARRPPHQLPRAKVHPVEFAGSR